MPLSSSPGSTFGLLYPEGGDTVLLCSSGDYQLTWQNIPEDFDSDSYTVHY
jgi:hypothetical protein